MLSVTLVTDGKDQSKFSLPRHEAMRSKEFASFQRPRLHISAAVCHGWCVVFMITPPETHKDSNTSIELLSHCLTKLKQLGAFLPQMHINVQSDNTCRECKNSMMMRWISSLVSSRCVRSGSLTCLRSGHSHEDIDQHFGRLSQLENFTMSGGHLGLNQRFFGTGNFFFEKERYAVLVNRTRDWFLSRMQGSGFAICGRIILPFHSWNYQLLSATCC